MKWFLSLGILFALFFILGFSHNYIVNMAGNVVDDFGFNKKEQNCLEECLPLGCEINNIDCIKSNSNRCIKVCNLSVTSDKFINEFIEKNLKIKK
jgi:hypothetical protein